MTRWLLVGGFLFAAFAIVAASAPQTLGCAFSVAPTTYDPPADRSAHMTALEMAGYNMIAPNNLFFGIPNVETGTREARVHDENPYIPPTLLKAIGWIESSIAQSDWNTPFGGIGPVLQSFDCGYGIMQITSGMTSPLDGGWPSKQQSLVGTHYLYDIGRGAAILADKWNGAPETRPIAGIDSGSDPRIIENWYFATWSYNGFTGPGASRSNHPSTPGYEWPRSGYSCGAFDDGYGHSYGDFPYQELVFGCAARPPVVDQQLWEPLALSLPDLEDPAWGVPLSLDTWNTCVRGYEGCASWELMDMITIQPPHLDPAERPSDEVAAAAHGAPVLAVSHTSVNQLSTTITITNIGQGILAWRADHQQDWFAIDKQAGVAISDDVVCSEGSPCQRDATLRITIAPELAPTDGSFGWVNIISLTTNQLWQVGVIPAGVTPGPTATQGPSATPLPTVAPTFPPTSTNTSTPASTPTPPPTPTATSTSTPVFTIGDVNCNLTANSIDATLVLQFSAGLVLSLPCPEGGDANQDGTINVVDATLILQLDSGLLDSLPPPLPA